MRFALAIATLLGTASGVAAQASTGQTGGQGPAGPVGSVGLGGGPLGLAWKASAGVAGTFGEFSVLAAGVTNVDISVSGNPGRHDESWEVALVYGRRIDLGFPYWVRLSGGPAYVRTIGQWEFTECSVDCTGVGSAGSVGLAAAAAIGRSRLSVGAFGNLNENRSFWGVTLDLRFGSRARRPRGTGRPGSSIPPCPGPAPERA